MVLRILASYEAKIAKICNLGTFWPVIQLITMFSKSDIALYTSMERWAKRLFAGFLKDGLLAEL